MTTPDNEPLNERKLRSQTSTLAGLLDAVQQLCADAPSLEQRDAIIARGTFRPAEDEAVGFWFARFLTTREHLWSLIDEVRLIVDKPVSDVRNRSEQRFFLVGYAAVCLLVKIDRLLLFEVADHTLIQRKLNEAFPEYRIARKQYTRIFSAFVDPLDALSLLEAMRYVERNRGAFEQLEADTAVGFIAGRLVELESALNPSKREHLKRSSQYVGHSVRRRSVVSAERLFARMLEGFGRAASEFCDMENKLVTAPVRDSLAELLEPGDVLVTRHAKALTNLFFPGYWPHAALYIGTEVQRQRASIPVDAELAARWSDEICVLEARKDGALLRPLNETLTVDAVAVLRPRIAARAIAGAMERAVQHEGKAYNFDFNFFNSDRVVCTELIYRAYDGLDGIEFPLQERAGRKTLSAEDLLDYALSSGKFEPVAIFGTPDSESGVVVGEDAATALVRSYRIMPDSSKN